jgi:hypothetical protein
MNDQIEEVVEELEVEAVEPPAREWTDEDAAEAKAFGWKAPEEWAGEKPEGYIDDPRRYMERASNFKPFKVLRDRQEKLEAEYAERFRRMEAVASRTLEQQRAQYERDMEAIRQQQLEAVETADRGRFEALEKQKSSLEPPPEFKPAPVAPEPPPELAEYVQKNEWVKNPILREAGRQLIDAAGMATRPALEQLQYAEQEVRKLYPAAFAPVGQPVQPARPSVQRVDGGGLGGSARASAFAALPPEAKSAFLRGVAQGIFQDNEADKKRYADDYANS